MHKQILCLLTGPWLRFDNAASIVVTGVSLTFCEIGENLRRAMMIILGLSVVYVLIILELDAMWLCACRSLPVH